MSVACYLLLQQVQTSLHSWKCSVLVGIVGICLQRPGSVQRVNWALCSKVLGSER